MRQEGPDADLWDFFQNLRSNRSAVPCIQIYLVITNFGRCVKINVRIWNSNEMTWDVFYMRNGKNVEYQIML
jgi:hypothetical protein